MWTLPVVFIVASSRATTKSQMESRIPVYILNIYAYIYAYVYVNMYTYIKMCVYI